MFWSRSPAHPRPALRTRLRLESLDDRVVPSSLFDSEPPLSLRGDLGGPPLNVAPRIINLAGVETGIGWYRFTGQVVDSTTVGGLTVTFAGVPSLQGQTTTTAADGTFSFTIRVNTDGSDVGEVRAQTTANGLTSDEASCYISPTPN
ncbi:MAG TPA: hypothetical protein VD866_21850 [Urbifossiella sp.]|nr:hypothetical protein [Urbifossiella sp.]